MRMAVVAAAAAGALAMGAAFAPPAHAALVLTDLDCALTDIDPAATACSGWFAGNLLNNAHVQDQIDALAQIGFAWDGDWAQVDLTKVNAPGDSGLFDFAGTLNGLTYIGIHKGQGGADGVEGTAFFALSADNLDVVRLNLNGGSSAVIYSTGVIPEPATWAMMILGFGGVGALLRRRRPAFAA